MREGRPIKQKFLEHFCNRLCVDETNALSPLGWEQAKVRLMSTSTRDWTWLQADCPLERVKQSQATNIAIDMSSEGYM